MVIDLQSSLREELESAVTEQTKIKIKKPRMYKVVMINDDYTPMDYVVFILKKFFSMDEGTAVATMLEVHNKGAATVGVFTYEVAEFKIGQVIEFTRKNEHPLQCRMEAA